MSLSKDKWPIVHKLYRISVYGFCLLLWLKYCFQSNSSDLQEKQSHYSTLTWVMNEELKRVQLS